MDSSDAAQLVLLLVLLALSAFFSSAETALTTVNKMRIRTLADAGHKRAKMLLVIMDDPAGMLSAILIGNNIVNLYASALMTSITISIWGNRYIGYATGVLTLLILVFGEITPKNLSTIYSEKVALSYAGIIHVFMIVLKPLVFLVNKLSLGFLMFLGVDPNRKPESITEDELRTIVEVSHEEGVIQSEEKKMINNVFDFGDSLAKDIMIPRIDMTLVDVNAGYDELIELFRREMYTRIPVYEDSTDNVIGIVNVKDLLLIDDKSHFSIRAHLRQPFYTYEFKKTAELMVEMRKTFSNMVIVLDEYGATAGMITLEDMLEEIVGEIRDEYDQDEEEDLVKLNEKEYLVDGSMKLDDVNEALDLKLESEDYDSIGGIIIGMLDHLPEGGEEVEYEGIRMVVERVDKNRIEKVHLYLPEKDSASDENVSAENASGDSAGDTDGEHS